MLAFVRQVLAFATGEVLETNWRILEGKLAKVQTVDQLLRDHVDFLDTCLKQCMLTTSKLLSVSQDSCSDKANTQSPGRETNSSNL
jgi:gamma-tubulin complex component 2